MGKSSSGRKPHEWKGTRESTIHWIEFCWQTECFTSFDHPSKRFRCSSLDPHATDWHILAQRQWEFPRKVVAIIDDVVICIYICTKPYQDPIPWTCCYLGWNHAPKSKTIWAPRQWRPTSASLDTIWVSWNPRSLINQASPIWDTIRNQCAKHVRIIHCETWRTCFDFL